MASTKTRYLSINTTEGNFVSRIISNKGKYDSTDVSLLRKLLSKEKAKILFTLKTKKPNSIYNLAKILGRDFKSVSTDINLLEKFGLVEFHSGKTGKRESKIPVLAVDKINIALNI